MELNLNAPPRVMNCHYHNRSHQCFDVIGRTRKGPLDLRLDSQRHLSMIFPPTRHSIAPGIGDRVAIGFMYAWQTILLSSLMVVCIVLIVNIV
ncbi:hypothetical protein NPIL_443151 [Nephila pilipes]|uniref:Uncharacterized protein n=1 Tax=Nephila pilipes TaxID=299642 RepID=A0A8X6NN87_NEPPI|nr:hypothetical protein NPIL_443151 [Nephila pilipes]